MGITRAIGLALFLIALSVLLPTVFAELAKTIIVFLQSSQTALGAAGVIAGYASHIPPTLPYSP